MPNIDNADEKIYDVFISYAHDDSAIAERIANYFSSMGITVFIDIVDLKINDSISNTIETAIKRSKVFLTLISSHSISHKWVHQELTLAKEYNIKILPFLLGDIQLPLNLRLLIEDRLHIEASKDLLYAIGTIPKLIQSFIANGELYEYRNFFSLSGSNNNKPHIQIFDGTLGSALEIKRHGRIAIVLPTSKSVNLTGRVTQSLLENLNLNLNELRIMKQPLEGSQDVTLLEQEKYKDIVLIAATVFNDFDEPYAKDQWQVAKAILNCAEQSKCNFVFVPPIGTGVFNWPVRQAIINWMFGAIQWSKDTNRTERSVWPIICVPGPGDQRIIENYLESLTQQRISALENGKFSLRVKYKEILSEEIQVNYDILLGALAFIALKPLEKGPFQFCHVAQLRKKDTQELFKYNADTPLSKTIFADGDIIEMFSEANQNSD